MSKHGSIVCKWRLCLPKGPINSACIHAHHRDRSAAVAIFANGTYFMDTPHNIICNVMVFSLLNTDILTFVLCKE
jgi:hypothetical protein